MCSAQIELLQPNKTNALPFIDQARDEPKRYARATIVFAATEEPYYQEYIVGPLPATNATAVKPLTYPFNNQDPGKTKVNAFYLQGPDVGLFVQRFASDIEDITQEIWNTVSLFWAHLWFFML